MMLRYTFGLTDEADSIEKAVKEFLAKGYRTPDLCGGAADAIDTVKTGDLITSMI